MKNAVLSSVLLLASSFLGACAVVGPRTDAFVPTYVFVFTVDSNALTLADAHCSSDCNTSGFDGKAVIFHVEDLDYRPARQFGQMMISPRWHQPDLATARQWGKCVVDAIERKTPGQEPIKVTSAYLIQVLSPVDPAHPEHRELPKRNPCELLKREK